MKRRKNIYTILYYLVLLLIMTTRTNVTSEPPMVLRLAYVFAIILPCLTKKTVSYPAIITMFLTIGHYGFSYSYMPYMTNIYGVLTLMMTFLLLAQRNGVKGGPPVFLVIFTIYVFVVDFVARFMVSEAHFPEDVDWCFLMLVCFYYFSYRNEENTKKQFRIAFAVITVVLSLFFLLFKDAFVRDYGSTSGLQRSGWADPNYFGMVIGMGVVVSVYMMLNKEWNLLSFAEKNLYRASVVLSLPTLALLASRGAFLSLIVAFVILLMFTKAKKGYKFLFIIIALVSVFWLYNNQYFELLAYRIANDDGTGSERTVIWVRKLDLFFEGNPIQWLFGHGFAGGFYLGGKGEGFHNEFVAFLVDYGIVGLVFLLYMLYYPFKLLICNSSSRPIVVAAISFLCVDFLTLEPFTHALMMFFSLYFYVVLEAKERSTIISNNS